MEYVELEGIIVDIDHTSVDERSIIRMTFKADGKAHKILDPSFYPYFYIIPFNEALDESSISKMSIVSDGEEIKIHSVSKERLNFKGKESVVLRIEAFNTRSIPKLSERLAEFGLRYEYDILFWKRYLIDKKISPLTGARIKAHEENGNLILDEIVPHSTEPKLSHLCFDIETYNPSIVPRPEIDPVIMISYETGGKHGVITTKKVNKDFVTVCKDEKSMILKFVEVIKESDPDIIAGYNSSNFDIPYLLKRSKKLGIDFDITRYGEEAREEHHGLVQAVKIPGRINLDVYNVTRFVSIVGASEKLLKINRFTLRDVYTAITGDTKMGENKEYYQKNTWKVWDGSDSEIEGLAEYSLGDSLMLDKLYDFFMPLEIEVARVTGTTIGEAAISTTGQLVEFELMKYSAWNSEIIPNKPSEDEITSRNENPIEGAYVKTPEAGIYDNIVVFDFRGLYPSIIIANNIDPSTLTTGGSEVYESPLGVKFKKTPQGIVPKVLEILIAERTEVKKQYKKDPDNKFLAARSQALKILANSFYGYLGYARSRWYSRDCAGSVTAFGRAVISDTMEQSERMGFKVIYGDSVSGDSEVVIMSENDPTSIKTVKIEDLFSHVDQTDPNGKEYQMTNKTYIETIDEDGKVSFRKAKYIMRHKASKKMYRVWLTNTLYIDATEDHSLIGFSNMAHNKDNNVMNRLVETKPLELGKEIKSTIIKKKSVRSPTNSRNYPKELYELMGFFIGDGSFDYGRHNGQRTKRYYLAVAAGNEQTEISSKMLSPLISCNMITSVYTKKKGDLVCTGLDTVRLFEKEILKDGCKRIPDFIFNESEKNVHSFLRGLFSSDGAVIIRNNKPIIRYTTIDKPLALQIHKLLWEVGIASSVFKENSENKYNGKGSGTYSYHVNVKTKDVFADRIGFLTNNKNLRISDYKETSFQKRYLRNVDFDISGVSRVEEIPSPEYVYDIEVEGVHRFFANGVLVHNTDSIFIIRDSKRKEEVLKLLDAVNKKLPGAMELELEDFYTRGVFVGKKGKEAAGAKKKYALLSEAGRIKIRGFELVRRDWSNISRETQRKVLEAILKEGSKEKAIGIVKDVVKALKDGNVNLKDLVIYTQLRKGLDNYDAKSPELHAAKKALEEGVKTRAELQGATIGYIITNKGSSISEKAEIEDTAKTYDPDYYINHQVLPATLKILKELGFSEEELKGQGSQRRL